MARTRFMADPADPDKLERGEQRKPRLDRHERPGAKHGNISNLPVRIAAVISLARAFICLALARRRGLGRASADRGEMTHARDIEQPMQLAQSLLNADCAQTAIEESSVRNREDMGDLVKLAGALAIFAVTFTTVAAFFNLAH